jgi:heat shock protein HslJ
MSAYRRAASVLAGIIVVVVSVMAIGLYAAEGGQNIPTGVELKVASIAGNDVAEGSNVTITFGQDGKLYGVASVNNYRSSWLAVGNRITILDCVSTMKMGLPPLMDQENLFLRTLPTVVRFESDVDGVSLITRNGEIIVLKL